MNARYRTKRLEASRQEATIDWKGDPTHVVCGIRCQVDCRRRNFFKVAEALHRNLAQYVFLASWNFQELCIDWSFEGSRRNRIDADTVGSPFASQSLRQSNNSCFARR